MSTNNNLTIGEIVMKTIPYLAEKKLPNPRLEADLMLAHVLEMPRVKIYSEWDRPLNQTEVQSYRDILRQRVQGIPLAYLTGMKSFLSWDFKVTPAVLIPRPDTEVLIEAVVSALKNKGSVTGADIGTGSGIIAIALAKLLPESHWYAVDLSKAALAVARFNAETLGVLSQIEFCQGDLVEPLAKRDLQLDVIVSNPPYIPSAELTTLQTEVQNEPQLALDGGPDGLAVYRRLLPAALILLKAEGMVAVEHGHDQRLAIAAIMSELGLAVDSYQDLAGIDRITVGRRS